MTSDMYYGCVRTYARKGTHTYSSDASPSLNHSAATKAEKHNTMLYVRTFVKTYQQKLGWEPVFMYMRTHRVISYRYVTLVIP